MLLAHLANLNGNYANMIVIVLLLVLAGAYWSRT